MREIWIQKSGTQDLRTYGWEVQELGRTLPARRGENWTVPGVDGESYVSGKPWAAGAIDLRLIVRAVNATTGAVTTTSSEHLEDNLDTVLGLLTGDRASLRTRTIQSDGTTGNPTREALIEVLEEVDVKASGPYNREMVVRCHMATPFWRELPELTSENIVGTYDAGGNAPITDAALTFSSGTDMRLTNNTNGDWVEFAGSAGTTTLDLSGPVPTVTGTLSLADMTRKRRRIFRLEPGTNSIALTGGGSVASDHYTKWHS